MKKNLKQKISWHCPFKKLLIWNQNTKSEYFSATASTIFYSSRMFCNTPPFPPSHFAHSNDVTSCSTGPPPRPKPHRLFPAVWQHHRADVSGSVKDIVCLLHFPSLSWKIHAWLQLSKRRHFPRQRHLIISFILNVFRRCFSIEYLDCWLLLHLIEVYQYWTGSIQHSAH